MTNKKVLRVARYQRIVNSGSKKRGFNQLAADLIRVRGWKKMPSYREAGTTSDRDLAFERLREDLRADRVDVVIVDDLGQLAGSLGELSSAAKLLEECGAFLISLEEGLDTTTSQGKLMLTLLQSVMVYEMSLTAHPDLDPTSAV